MKISTILDHIDSGHIALPEFQRGYVWNRAQVRNLFESLYKRYPVGGLLVWATASTSASHRGDGPIAAGVVKLLLDGQQRITSLYGVVRGHPPRFFDGNPKAFTDLRFHLDKELFEFYQPVKMRGDPLWIDVSELMREGLGKFIGALYSLPQESASIYLERLNRLFTLTDIDLHVEEITGPDKNLDVVVDIFNRVNSGGTGLSQGDLALAKVCVTWTEGRSEMQARLHRWAEAGFHLKLDWLLRSVNAVLTGEAKFQFLQEKTANEIQDALARTSKHIDIILNLISSRLGLDHDRVLFGRYAVPVMARYLEQRSQKSAVMDQKERDKLLFWYVQAAMWGRFSGSTEATLDQDLEALNGGLDNLLRLLRHSRGGLRAEANHFTGDSLSARFYPVLYMLTRMGEARDWGLGLPLRATVLGQNNRLEVHHIFPKSQLKKLGYSKEMINAIANFCFLSKATNLHIGNRLPEEYFLEIEAQHPGALASQWIPADRALWKVERFRDFLEARKELLAAELNRRMEELLHGDTQWITQGTAAPSDLPAVVPSHPGGEVDSADFEALNEWVATQGLPRGEMPYQVIDPDTGTVLGVFDLAWPSGIQEELSQPVALVLEEDPEALALASQAGFRCFTNPESFKQYVLRDVLGEVYS